MSDNQVIPEAAVEAANEAVLREFGAQINPAVVDAILEAAAPHMLADVWDAAIEAHKAWTWDDENMDALANPYRPTP